MELGRDSCALGSEKAESAHVFASRAFVTVTLAAQIVYEEKTDRVHPHGPLSDALDHTGGTLGHDRHDRCGHARTLATPSSRTSQRTHSRWTERTCEL